MMKLMNSMMIPCNSMTQLVEKQNEFGITIKERIQIALHKSMCADCTSYHKQSVLINKLLSKTLPVNYDAAVYEETVNLLKKNILTSIRQERS